jgi:hypothetical protein
VIVDADAAEIAGIRRHLEQHVKHRVDLQRRIQASLDETTRLTARLRQLEPVT